MTTWETNSTHFVILLETKFNCYSKHRPPASPHPRSPGLYNLGSFPSLAISSSGILQEGLIPPASGPSMFTSSTFLPSSTSTNTQPPFHYSHRKPGVFRPSISWAGCHSVSHWGVGVVRSTQMGAPTGGNSWTGHLQASPGNSPQVSQGILG